MFTPGRCKKTIFCSGATVWGFAVCPAVTPRPAWGDASAVTAGGTSGEATAADDSDAKKNWELIQPLKRPFSTCVQSPFRRLAVNRVPFGAVPRTVLFAVGVDLMLTPGRCKKTISWFSHGGTV